MCRSPEGNEEGLVTWIEYLGSIQRVKLSWDGRELVAEVFSKQVKHYHFEVGDVVRFDFNKDEHIQILF
ncbi:MAG: TOBE domain-containing protein [Desulfitobacteriaceae bacterium]